MPLRLAVTFWGSEYRRYFLDYCLASLLAEGNLPALCDPASTRLLVAIPDDDWAALQTEPTFVAAKKLITIEQISFDPGRYSGAHEKILVMSRAHKLLAARMFDDRAHGVFLYPDMIAAKGFIAKLEELRSRGLKVVMFMNVRFTNERLLEELGVRSVPAGKPLQLSSRDLVKLTLRHMHSEMRRSDFDGVQDDYGCTSFFWWVSSNNLLFHCANWVPSLIDYSAIDGHDESTFDSSSLDADYIARNLETTESVHFVRDSDEMFMISFSPEPAQSSQSRAHWAYRIPHIRENLKIARAHDYLYRQGVLDWVKKEQFPFPIRFRGEDIVETHWQKVEQQAARIVSRIGRRSSPQWTLAYAGYCFATMWCHYMTAAWTRRRRILLRLGQMMRGDRQAWQRALARARRVSSLLLGR